LQVFQALLAESWLDGVLAASLAAAHDSA